MYQVPATPLTRSSAVRETTLPSRILTLQHGKKHAAVVNEITRFASTESSRSTRTRKSSR